MRYSVLGPIEVEHDGVVLALGGPRQRRLLGALLGAGGKVVGVDQLAAAVWGDEPEAPDTGPKVLQSYVSRLRTALGDGRVVTHDGGYSLRVEAHELDADRFAGLVDAARSCPPGRAVGLLDDALALWRGHAFGEFADERWARPHATRLEELRLVAHELRAQALLDSGRHAEAVPELESLCALHPLRERLRGQLLLALHRSGRQAEALRAFAEYRRYLADETGLDPSRAVVELERRIALDDPALAFVTTGRTARGYVLADVIGEGAFGTVYRAVQPSVGREVAVKVVRPELADDPAYIRRFDAEARMVARLEHPGIVPLYDYWREPGGAYLVFRYLRGGTVADRPRPWPLHDADRLVVDIGTALAAAHAQGVVHRDVKPANLLRDDDGRTYLADFGIALDAPTGDGPAAIRSAGSPLYASPEQIRDGAADERSDQYALGIVVWELLAGRAPFEADTVTRLLREKLARPVPPLADVRPDLPEAIGRVLQRATALDPAGRYASMLDLIAAWTGALAAGPAPVVTTGSVSVPAVPASLVTTRARLELDVVNPYKGLRAFDEADAGDFFGRAESLERLRAAVAAHRLVVVVGPSGSGKSSLVRAGLVPALRADGHLVGVALPGARPVDEIADVLWQLAADPPAALREALVDPDRLTAVAEALAPDGGELVLVLDQLEELWTLAAPTERDALLAALAGAVAATDGRLRVVATIRADFYDRPLAHAAVGALVRDGTFPLSPLTAAEIEEAIVAPAARLGVHPEPALRVALLADVASRPNALPLLQFALTELFAQRDGAAMTAATYTAMGGLNGVLATRAEQVHTSVDADGARRLFLRLVTPGEGTEDTRRRARRHELSAVPAAVVDAFGAARLLTFDVDPATREPTVEVAHEALLRHWPRLRGWLDEDRDGLRIHRHVAESAATWEGRGRDPGDLYRGARLDDAVAWSAGREAELTTLEREFLALSRRRVRRARALARTAGVGLIALAAVALVAAGLAISRGNSARLQRDAAEALRRDADVRRLVAESAVAGTRDPALSLLLAREARLRQQNLDTEASLLAALGSNPAVLGYLRGGSPTYRLAASRDGSRLFVGRVDGRLDVWDLATRRLVVSGRDVGATGYLDLELSPDGSLLALARGLPFSGAAGDRDWTVGVYRTSDLSPVIDALPERADPETTRGTARPTFLDDHTLLVPATGGRLVRYDLRAPAPVAETVYRTDDRIEVASAAPAHDRVVVTTVLAAGGLGVVLLRASDFGVVSAFTSPIAATQIQEAWLSADGTRILTCGIGSGGMIDATTGALVGPLIPFVCGLDELPDGTVLDVSGALNATLRGPKGEALGPSTDLRLAGQFRDTLVVGDLAYIATYAKDGAIPILDPRALAAGSPRNAKLALAVGDEGAVDTSPDGTLIAVMRPDGTAAVVDATTGRPRTGTLVPQNAKPAVLNGIYFADDGTEIYTGGITGAITVFGVDGTRRRVLPLRRTGEVRSVSATPLGPYAGDLVAPGAAPDGRITAWNFNRVTVLDATTGSTRFVVELPPDDIRDITSLAVAGRYLIYTDPADTAQRVSWDDGTPLGPFGDPGDSLFVATVPGTDDVAVWSPTRATLRVVDAATGAVVRAPIPLPGVEASAMHVDRAGRRVVIEGLSDGRYHVVDLAEGRLVGTVAQSPSATLGARFALGGKALVTPGSPVQIWDMDPASWMDKACRVAARNLTRLEWERYLPPGEPYRATCPDLPAAG